MKINGQVFQVEKYSNTQIEKQSWFRRWSDEMVGKFVYDVTMLIKVRSSTMPDSHITFFQK